MSWWVQHWPDLKWNVIAEGLGVVAELILTYVVIGYLLNRRDERRRRPATLTLMRQLAKTHAVLVNASRQVIRQYSESGPLPPFETCEMFLGQLRHSLSNLHLLVIVNGASLTSESMARTAVFLDSAELASKKLQFFADALRSNWATVDVVGPSPIAELESISSAVEYLKSQFPTVFESDQTGWPNPPRIGEVAALWSSSPQKSGRLCFDPSEYEWKEGIGVFVYDVRTQRSLPRPSTDKAQIYLYNNMELCDIQFPA